MAYSERFNFFRKKPEKTQEDKKEIPAVPLEVLAQQAEKENIKTANSHGELLTKGEDKEIRKTRLEQDGWREQQ